MMAVSVGTVLAIQGNDTSVSPYGPNGDDKYGFAIALNDAHRGPRLLVSSNPIYCSSDEAKGEGVKIRDELKALDLSKEKEGLVKLMGDDGPLIQKIVDASKGSD